MPFQFYSLAESVLPYKLFARSGIHEMLVVGGDKVIVFYMGYSFNFT